MITKTYGTLLEWMKHDPEAYVTNPKYIPYWVFIGQIEAQDDYSGPHTYTADRPFDCDRDMYAKHSNPTLDGNGYVCKGLFKYSCYSENRTSGAGGVHWLSDEMVNDPNWVNDGNQRRKDE